MSNDPPIRVATRSDALPLHGLIGRGYRGGSARLGWTHPPDLVDGERVEVGELMAAVDGPGQMILVAEEGGALIGCVQISDEGDRACTLELLCVEPRRQARGLGKRLIAAAEREAAARFEATRMEMTVIERRTELIAYYGRRGYAPTGERRPFPVEGVQLPLVVLAKAIASAR